MNKINITQKTKIAGINAGNFFWANSVAMAAVADVLFNPHKSLIARQHFSRTGNPDFTMIIREAITTPQVNDKSYLA